MEATFENFRQLFAPLTFVRAKSYFNAGRVGEIGRNGSLLHATVDGSNLYDVDIRIKGNTIASVACTYPYNKSSYCKHVGAVFCAIRGGYC